MKRFHHGRLLALIGEDAPVRAGLDPALVRQLHIRTHPECKEEHLCGICLPRRNKTLDSATCPRIEVCSFGIGYKRHAV